MADQLLVPQALGKMQGLPVAEWLHTHTHTTPYQIPVQFYCQEGYFMAQSQESGSWGRILAMHPGTVTGDQRDLFWTHWLGGSPGGGGDDYGSCSSKD